jgi:tight adherence protein C
VTLELAVSLSLVFVSVAVLTGTIASTIVRRHAPERRRLRDLAQPIEKRVWRDAQLLTDTPNALAERICRLLPRSAERMDQMRQRCIAAGHRSQTAPVVLAASQIVCAIAVGMVILAATGHGGFALLTMAAGFLLPDLWLAYQIKERGRVIRNGLPDVLDLLIVCLESGCSLDQAIVKSAEELSFAYKPLGDELALVSSEVRAGKARSEAFQRFATRTRVDDVRALVAMLVQTDRYGTSIAHALRTHADLFRTRRRQRAEERAAKASVKLVFPLVFCLFPAFYLISLGPTILQVARLLFSAIASTGN